ncbi:MAG: proton-coupled thiamine transporter YuaJ [Lachnospiraceae bacterium]|nr:proton-coupled thiamine transporter YuaJ [Lachnospiraceae bacterium]
MFSFMVTEDGGLTKAGYGAFIGLGILFLAGAVFLAVRGREREKAHMGARELVFCAAAVALAFLTSYIRVVKMPWGGSVTLCSMLFICLIGYWYGVKTGIMAGLAYGILQFLQEPYVLSFFQVCCDYVLAFAALGLAGMFAGSKKGLVKGYLWGAFLRGVFHSIGGYLYWMEYMPDSFPKSLTAVYPILYNYAYIGAEAAMTVLLLSIPAVAAAMERVKRQARG